MAQEMGGDHVVVRPGTVDHHDDQKESSGAEDRQGWGSGAVFAREIPPPAAGSSASGLRQIARQPQRRSIPHALTTTGRRQQQRHERSTLPEEMGTLLEEQAAGHGERRSDRPGDMHRPPAGLRYAMGGNRISLRSSFSLASSTKSRPRTSASLTRKIRTSAISMLTASS